MPHTSSSRANAHHACQQQENEEHEPICKDSATTVSKRQQKRLSRLLRYMSRLLKASSQDQLSVKALSTRLAAALHRISSIFPVPRDQPPFVAPEIMKDASSVLEALFERLLSEQQCQRPMGDIHAKLVKYSRLLLQSLPWGEENQRKLSLLHSRIAASEDNCSHHSTYDAVSTCPCTSSNAQYDLAPNSFDTPSHSDRDHPVSPPSAEELADLVRYLGKIPLSQWWKMEESVINKMTSQVLYTAEACTALHAAIAVAQDAQTASSRPSEGQSGTELHPLQPVMGTQRPGRTELWGPSPSQVAEHVVLSFLLQRQLYYIKQAAVHKQESVKAYKYRNELIHRVLGLFRTRHLPPDRQVILMLLQYTLSNVKKLGVESRHMDSMDWLWNNWTLLRECSPRSALDDKILVAFLETAALISCKSHWELGAEAQHQVPPWMNTILDFTTRDMDLNLLPLSRYVAGPFEGDFDGGNQEVQLLATAVAAFSMRRFDIGIACLYDGRLRPADIPPIFTCIARALERTVEANSPLAHALAKSCMKRLRSLARRLTKPLSEQEGQSIMALVEVLTKIDLRSALELYTTLDNPLSIGDTRISRFLKLLERQGQTSLLLRIYSRMQPEHWSDRCLGVFLSSQSSRLSDMVWSDSCRLSTGPSRHQLNARLRHHKRRRPFWYPQALRECRDTLRQSQWSSDDPSQIRVTQLRLMELHLKARNGKAAADIHDSLRKLDSNDASDLNLRYLQLANIPKSHRYRDRGVHASLRRTSHRLDAILAQGKGMGDRTTVHLLLNNLKWAELDDSAIWSILKNAPTPALERWDKTGSDRWHLVKPLYSAVVRAFRQRGNSEAAREAVLVMLNAKEKAKNRMRKQALV